MGHNLPLKIFFFHSKELFFFWAHRNFHDLPHFFFTKLEISMLAHISAWTRGVLC